MVTARRKDRLGWRVIPAVFILAAALSAASDYPHREVPFSAVRMLDTFWQPRLETNHRVTIPAVLRQCEVTGRIQNFLNAGKVVSGQSRREPFCSYFSFDDSDVYKLIEGAAYSLALFPDPELEKRIDSLIVAIAAAQEPDGYLYTNRTVDPARVLEMSGKTRWEKEDEGSHELYNAGHLIEAGIAYFQATGKRALLDVARRSADLIDNVFGYGKLERAPNHQGIEIAMTKLYRLNGEKKYLDLGRFFLDVRGKKGEEYSQQQRKPVEQRQAVGHAVRGAYMYSGMADVAALTGDDAMVDALDALWNDVVSAKLYLTGGIGSTGEGEAFGKPYELPNQSAYCETCAAIANIFWNWRMFRLHGDGRYIDVLERSLYNGFLSGVSLSGDRFFYTNPLTSWGNRTRSWWFACACCPPNIARFMPTIGGYLYASAGSRIYVNLYAESTAEIEIAGRKIGLRQHTGYPWQGEVRIAFTSAQTQRFTIALRIPGWAQERPVPSALYRFLDDDRTPVTLAVNGERQTLKMEKGYAVLEREWRSGDEIALALPMSVRRVHADDGVVSDRGRIALQRGPLVYCAEGNDNGGSALTLVVDAEAALRDEPRADLLNGITAITGVVKNGMRQNGGVALRRQELLAIPYYSWANRERTDMTVWLASDPERIERFPQPPTIASTSRASASHVYDNSLPAVNDRFEPRNSADRSNNALRFHPHRGTTEWVRYDFAAPETVSAAKVYWLQDGAYLAPVSWKILYLKEDGCWEAVKNRSPYTVAVDTFATVAFEPVRTKALKLELSLRPDISGGIIEWVVE